MSSVTATPPVRSGERRRLLRWGGCFFACTTFLLALVGLRYLHHLAWPDEGLAQLYVVTAYVGHFAILGFLPWLLLLLPLTLLWPARRLIMALGVLLGACTLSGVCLDSLVFVENQFHINALTMTILGWRTWAFGLLYLLLAALFLSMLAKLVWTRVARPFRYFYGGWVALVLCLTLLTSQVLHIWGDANYYVPITRFTHFLPLYYPSTAKRFLVKHGLVDLKQNRERQLVRSLARPSRGGLNYPLKPLQCTEKLADTNVLMILLDAMRYDALSPQTTPNLSRFAEGASYFTEHYSGGNSSRMGLFSLFYGLPSNYWQDFEGLQRTPVLMDEFQRHGYQLGIFGSAPLYRPTSLDRTVFARVPHLAMVTRTESWRSYKRDQTITREWINWLERRDPDKPFFGFLFYDGPNSRDYPPNYGHVFSAEGGGELAKEHASYQTAIRFDDGLIGEVLDDLERRGLLNKTIVLITADHGEEFDENGLGFKGHGTSYYRYQIKVPFILRWPGKSPQRLHYRTSHNDWAPTLMQDLFGCSNPTRDFSSGRNLFSGQSWPWLLVGSYYNFAIIEPDQITICYPSGVFEVRDKSYRIIKDPELHRDVVSEALKETKRFYFR